MLQSNIKNPVVKSEENCPDFTSLQLKMASLPDVPLIRTHKMIFSAIFILNTVCFLDSRQILKRNQKLKNEEEH